MCKHLLGSEFAAQLVNDPATATQVRWTIIASPRVLPCIYQWTGLTLIIARPKQSQGQRWQEVLP